MQPQWCRSALLALIVWQLVWFGLWDRPPEWPVAVVVLGLSLVPLLIVLPGVWRLKLRSLVLAGAVLLVYFSVGAAEAYAGSLSRTPALIQIALVIVYFMGLAAASRRPGRAD